MEDISALLKNAQKARLRLVQSEQELREQMERVFERRAAANKRGNTDDIVRGQ